MGDRPTKNKDQDRDKEKEEATQAPTRLGGLVLPEQVLPPNLFLIPYGHAVIFPTMMAPLHVAHSKFIATVDESISRQRFLGLLMPKEAISPADCKTGDLYDVGVVVKILKRLKMPDGSINLLVHSVKRFKVKRYLSEHPHWVAEVAYLDDVSEKSNEMDALTRSVISHVKRLSEVNPFFTDEMRFAMLNAPGPGIVADLVAFALSLQRKDAQEFLETLSVKLRFEKLLIHLKHEQELADLQKKIQDDVNTKITTMQREFFLKEQLKVIKKELGLEEDGKTKSSRTFRERIEDAGMPEDVKKTALEEVTKFETLSESSPEYNVTRNYLETLVSMPWSKETVDQLDLKRARTVLDAHHFGLEKVKDRIVEFLAVRKNVQAQGAALPKGSILCLVGPPGVGKTSVGKSIAETMGRNFYRFSLGGMRDEAEIKGHRRTYVGAMPGKVIQAVKRAGSKNAVLMLDEIDKLSQGVQGDPASALLEVLDPEQNQAFLDHYLDVPFDLSKILFVATANTVSTIPGPLLDRMEVIELSGYTLEEKENIALKYVIPKVLKEFGLKPTQFKISKEALRSLLLDYAREPGMRTVQQLVERLGRKALTKLLTSAETKHPIASIVISKEDLLEYLGPKRFYHEISERITHSGVVVGLAWTAMGGDILFIESKDIPGTGQLKLTGQMGEVMTESASIAWSYVKGRTQRLLKDRDVHLHIPAGAVPKDGPSAGITMATALYSMITGRRSKAKLAMTGELSLIGKVLPVGGIKEKLLAAKRSGVQTVLLPKLNEKDLLDIPKSAIEGLKIIFVSHVDEVFDHALESGVKTYKTKPLLKKAQRAKVRLSSANDQTRYRRMR